MELIIDNFAGGGGASTGIEMALGRSPDVAINHDPEALALHEANHPKTRHYASDVFEIDPRVATRNQKVGLAWFSPDCKHHSKARGGMPVSKRVRGLAWVVIKWAEQVRPRVIILENVEEFQEWGPVVQKVGTDGFPVFDTKGRPWYVPCQQRKGKTFKTWVRKLERLGYAVEWRQLRACDYGAPTIRKRLFLIARCDGRPIVWPEPTHGDPRTEAVKSGARLAWRTAAEIIDWSLPCPSIFLSPEEAKIIGCKRPLKPATMKRIAAGVKRYVLDAARPFIVVCNHGGDWFRGRGVDQPAATVTASRDANGLVMPFVSLGQHGGSNRSASTPLNTITASTKDQNCIVAPFLAGVGGRKAQSGETLVDRPLHTTTAKADAVVVAAHLQRQFGRSDVADIEQPAPTVMPAGGGKSALVAAFLAQHNTGMVGHKAESPVSTITARATQQQVVAATLHERILDLQPGLREENRPGGTHAAQVMAFLSKYYGTAIGQDCREPIGTVVSHDRFGLVSIEGVDYHIVDIGMRMLSPRELFRAQGFPDSYIIDPMAERRVIEEVGKRKKWRVVSAKKRPLTKTAQVRMCGNSVCPPLAAALVRANVPELGKQKRSRQRELAGV